MLTDYLQRGKTYNGQYHAELLLRLREEIKKKRRGKLPKGVLILQDNAPSHNSHVALEAIRDCKFKLVDHPPYSPDLASSDYHLFPSLKKAIRGKHFGIDDELITAVEEWFSATATAFTNFTIDGKNLSPCIATKIVRKFQL